MRTKAGFGIAVFGAIVLLAGIVSIIYSSTHSQAEVRMTSGESAYVMTNPGVLDLINTKVHVSCKSANADADVSLGIGASEDVQAWSEGLHVVEVTGLKDWRTLDSKERQAEVEEIPVVAGSDMWVFEKSGKGEVTFDYKVESPGNTSFIAHASDGSPLTVTLSWKRPHILVSTLPYIVIGGLIIAIGVVLSLIGLREGEESIVQWFNSVRQEHQNRKKKTSEKPLDISDLDISVPSRDELVNQERDQQREHTGGTLGAGIIPLVDEDFRKEEGELTKTGELPDFGGQWKGQW